MLLASSLFLSAASAVPAPALPTAFVLPYGGDAGAEELERLVARALNAGGHLEIVPPMTVLQVLGAAHVHPATELAEAGRLLNASQAVRIERTTFGVRVSLVDCATGAVLKRVFYPLEADSTREIRATIDDRLFPEERPAPRPALLPLPPPTPEPPAPAPEPPVPAAPPTSVPASPAPVLFDVALGGGSLWRRLTYKDDLFHSLSDYELGAGPLAAGSIAFYPFELLDRGFWGSLFGVQAEFEHTVGLVTSSASGHYPSLGDHWLVAAKLRLLQTPSELGLSVGYGRQELLIGTEPSTPAPPVPSYAYGFVRFAVDGRLQLGRFALLPDAAFLLVTDDGIKDSGYFPHATVAGFEAGLAVAWAVYQPMELRLGANYRQFFFALNPAVGDANVAGGALDQFLVTTLTVALRVQ